MATFVLIHGAGGSDGWYWHLVEPELRALGHDVVAPSLPGGGPVGLAGYRDTVLEAVGDRTDLVVVGQSLGGFTAPLVADRLPVDLLVLVAAMVPAPGETFGDWWDNTGHSAEVSMDFDVRDVFFHDVPAEVTEAAFARPMRGEGDLLGEDPWPLPAWPDTPTRFLLCRDDRFFPADFQRRVVRERLGITPDEMDGGHLPAFGQPKELARRLDGYLR